MGFSRQEYWSGLPCLPPGDLPDPGVEPAFPVSPALAGGFFTTSATLETRALLHYTANLVCPTLCFQKTFTEEVTLTLSTSFQGFPSMPLASFLGLCFSLCSKEDNGEPNSDLECP